MCGVNMLVSVVRGDGCVVWAKVGVPEGGVVCDGHHGVKVSER